jgi:hypothetical protein
MNRGPRILLILVGVGFLGLLVWWGHEQRQRRAAARELRQWLIGVDREWKANEEDHELFDERKTSPAEWNEAIRQGRVTPQPSFPPGTTWHPQLEDETDDRGREASAEQVKQSRSGRRTKKGR